MLVINGNILTMADRNFHKGFLYIKNGKIAEIGDMDMLNDEIRRKNKTMADPLDGTSGTVIDAEGCIVMPGLIDAHCHVGISEEKWGTAGEDCNETTNPITPHIRALDAVSPMDPAFHDAIAAGITSLMTGPGSSNIIGGQSIFMKVQGRSIDKMAVKPFAAMKIAFGENPKKNYGQKDVMPISRMAIAGMLREELYKALSYKEKKEKGNIDPSQADFRMECYLPVLNREIPLKAHVHRADDILTAIRIAKEFNLKMTLDHCTEGHLIADEIAESGFPAIIGPDLSARSKIEIKNMTFKTAGILEKAGVKTAIMTDHPVSLIQYLPLCAGLSVRQGLSMEGGLKAITLHAAQICGVADRIGSLETGKDADIAIFTGNPMEVFTETKYTIIDGKIVYDYKAL